MKHKTYRELYRAHFGHIDKKSLLQARAEESDPFYRRFINLVLGEETGFVQWDTKPFTTDFRSGSPRQRLDETVFAFILRLVDICKEERHRRVFRKPESYGAIMAWDSMLSRIVLCALALLYDVRWTTESVFEFLDPAVRRLLDDGQVSTLRNLLINLGVTPARETPYQAESQFGKLNSLHVGQYGSFYWRFLHWMAEAYDLRKDKEFYKNEWLTLLDTCLYRTLRCGICMVHYRIIVEQLKPRLTDPDVNLSQVFFDIHNQVHAIRRRQNQYLKEPDYTQSEYERDRSFMIQALGP